MVGFGERKEEGEMTVDMALSFDSPMCRTFLDIVLWESINFIKNSPMFPLNREIVGLILILPGISFHVLAPEKKKLPFGNSRLGRNSKCQYQYASLLNN